MLESPWLMAWESLCILWTCFPPSCYIWPSSQLVPTLTGFAPEVYAAWPKSRMDLLDFSHAPPLQSDQRVMHVLCKEILRSAHGPTDKVKAIQPTWLLSMANVSTIGVKAAEAGASDGPSTSHAHLILQ